MFFVTLREQEAVVQIFGECTAYCCGELLLGYEGQSTVLLFVK